MCLPSFLSSDLLSSDYVEIHYEDGKPQYSKVLYKYFHLFEQWKCTSIFIMGSLILWLAVYKF